MFAPAWLILTLNASPDDPNKDSLSWDPDAIRRGAGAESLAVRTGMDALGIVEVWVWEPLLTTEDTVWDTRGPIWARI